MEFVSNSVSFGESWPDKWAHISKLCERASTFSHPHFEPGPQNLDTVHRCKILVVGAGGLGCELLKDLALSGFQSIDVIDMDTIDLSNLNREFDVGNYKAEVAAKFVSNRVVGCTVTPHNCKIQDKHPNFYSAFNIIICGLDSIVARRWLNGTIVLLLLAIQNRCVSFQLGRLEYDDQGVVDAGTIIPIIDGGTEGFKGNARVILPGLTPCIECTIELYPPQVNFPLCTIAHTPRLPEHCVEFVKLIQWEKDKPFQNEDNPLHVKWVFEQATIRAAEYRIQGVTYRLTQGVLKRIIPAVASTNAVIAAACALEAFKLATNVSLPMNNYMNYNDSEGVFLDVISLEKRDSCLACSGAHHKLHFSESSRLQEIVHFLTTSPQYQMKSPSLTAPGNTLYMPNVCVLEQRSSDNLKSTLKDLGLKDGVEIAVADETLSQAVTFRLQMTPSDMEIR